MIPARHLVPGLARPRRRGFALVVTIALMVLLAVTSIGLLGLSAVALRSAGQGEAHAAARANARLALLLAIGELQRQAGPDTRVTARADILDAGHPPVTGAWRSWEGTDHETGGRFAGRPVSPGDYDDAKRDRFLGWLVSGSQPGAAELPDTARGAGKATLVGPGSVGAGENRVALQVHLAPVPVTGAGTPGHCAWWVAGENQKARLPQPWQPEDDTAARWSVYAKSHAVADPQPFRLDPLLESPEPAQRVATLAGADLLEPAGGGARSRQFFHDLTAVSVGLLTNTATGGWRKDLSHLTENWDRQPAGRLALFRLSPGRDIQFSRPSTASPVAAGSMLYPWAAYRGGQNIPIYQHGPVTSWANLADYATAYKRITAAASGRNRMANWSVAIDNAANSFGFLHKVRVLPVVARMQWVFSHTAGPAATTDKLEPRLLLTPVITMWNPYSVELTGPPVSFSIPKPLPAALRYTINGVTNPAYNALTAGARSNTPTLSTVSTLNYQIAAGFTLKPGETRVFSPASTTPVPPEAMIDLRPGYRAKGGHYFRVLNSAGMPMAAPRGATIKADARFDTIYDDFAASNVGTGVGIYLDMLVGGERHLVYRMVYTAAVAGTIYKPLTQMAEATLSQCQTNPVPFLSTIFGARMASRTHLAAKGFVQSCPLVNYTAMGRKDQEEATIGRHYGGTGHPVNSPFDYSFVKHAPAGDSLLPNSDDATGRGYIVTGFNRADGLSRCVIAELPVRPLASLGELQNWDLRYENPIPPFAFNLVGNSDATPLLPADAVVNRADASLAENLQYDDSFCANHLLFDDWFFSSIAPDPNHFGAAGRNAQQAFADFLTGTAPLANRAYRPLAADRAAAAADPAATTRLYNAHVKPVDSWLTIASRLEVEGMFNVNSTSVTAWRALLGHARGQRVPHVREAGTSWSLDLSGPSDHVLGRFTIAGDSEAGTPGSSGDFPEATEFAGYRTVDDDLVDELAEEVVEQVRARGPFLSLAEFVNRQLSSGELALAGTIQAALNQLAQHSATNPFAAIEALSTTAVAVPERPAEAEYQFPAAAAGKSAYGLPGWTRQADVLRPLAPILSARDDTFTIRAYGDARDGAGRITARAVAEAVVRRTRDFVDPRDAADAVTGPTRPPNRAFGRHFELVSFRWLAPEEV